MSFPTIVFDDGLRLLSPLTDLRAAFDVRTGVLTTIERLQHSLNVIGLQVPPSLAALTGERHAAAINEKRLHLNDPVRMEQVGGPVLLLNGRAPLGILVAMHVKLGQVLRDHESGDLVAAACSPEMALRVIESGFTDLSGLIDAPAPRSPVGRWLISRPWHVRSFRDECIKADLDHLVPRVMRDVGWPELPAGTLRLGTADLAVSRDANICPGAFFDTTLGPILIDDEAVIRPGAIISGPAAIGPHAHVLDRCIIKPNTVIGPWCKVAGEVGGTIFQGMANKAHDGHLGDSYIGEWANLGAGTTNSNLLNTYGEVIARPFEASGKVAGNERTGETFLGCIVGDHAKFAICTRIMTGAIVGTGTMWAATAPVTGTVGRMQWVTDAGTKPYAAHKFLEVAATVMARRKLTMSAAYRERLLDLATPPATPDRSAPVA